MNQAKKFDNKLIEAADKLRIRFAVRDFSKKLGYSKGAVSDYVNNKVRASENFISKFKEVYGIDLESLGENKESNHKQNNGKDSKEKSAKNVKEIRKRLGLTQTELGKKLGVSLSTIQKWESGKYPVSKSNLTAVKELLINSSSFVNESSVSYSPKLTENRGVPYYDVDFTGGFDLVFNEQNVKPSYFINYEPYNKADAWINVVGKSMSPFISHGDLVAIKKLENWRDFMPYGEIYAIITTEHRTIKIVTAHENNDLLTLIPYNKSPEFISQSIPKKLITNIYAVKGSIKKFF